eukprot:gene1565-12690_t
MNGTTDDLRQRNASTNRSSHSILCTLEDSCPPIFENCIIAVSSDYDSLTRHGILMQCRLLGAKVKPNYETDCTHYISQFQTNEDFEAASSENKTIVSLQWLQDCIKQQSLLKPFKIGLHYPLKDPKGISKMKNLVISVTGYVGEERNELKYLIRSSGAKYSGSLSKKENTHLICKYPEGEKFRRALEWDISVVNERWLFSCIEHWDRIDEKYYFDIEVNR